MAIVFVVSLAVLWSLVLWNIVVAFAGFRFRQRRARLADEQVPGNIELPGVSIMIPCRNEERVIERSLRKYLSLGYPRGRLEVVVIDDASSDRTGEICNRIARHDRRLRVVHIPPSLGGRGKSAALNFGLRHCRKPYVAIYDADNRPRANALRLLMTEIVRSEGRYAAAVGRIVKSNRRNTLLNRFCSFEFSAFQWTVQAGRARLFDLVLLPGTNFVIERGMLEQLGGWDPRALTEDLELSVRIYAGGRRICFVPEAVSQEQDPERLRPWLRQRVRWMLGNYYVIRKHTPTALRTRDPRIALEIAQLTYVYAVFLLGLIASDAVAIGGLFGLGHIALPGPYIALWAAAFLVFVALFQLTEALEGNDRWSTPFVAALMYLTYTQLWLYVSLRALVRTFEKRQQVWETTPRFQD